MSLPLLNNKIQEYVNTKLNKDVNINNYKILSTYDVRNVEISNNNIVTVKSDSVNGLNVNKIDNSYASIEIYGSVSDISNMIIIRPDKSDTSGNITIEDELEIDTIDMKTINTEYIDITNISDNDVSNVSVTISNNNKILNIDGILSCGSIQSNNTVTNGKIDINSGTINTEDIYCENLVTQYFNTYVNSENTTEYYIPNTISELQTKLLRASYIQYFQKGQATPTDFSTFNTVYIQYWTGGSNYSSSYIREEYINSDNRFKHDEENIDLSFSLNVLQNINSYKYKYKKEKENSYYEYGFMADEVKQVIPDAVYTKPTLIDIENISCSYEMVFNSEQNINNIELKNIKDTEFDDKCQFYMMYCSCDFSSIPIVDIRFDISNCIIDTTHNLNYISQYKTDHIREYLYAYKNNIRIKINGIEYVTKLIYDSNINTNKITIDISGIPITSDITMIDIYRPIECVTYLSDVIEVGDNEDGTRDYKLNITNEMNHELIKIENGEMIWYKVNVNDGQSLDYRKIFMQYHNIIKEIDSENIKMKEQINSLELKLDNIIENMNI